MPWKGRIFGLSIHTAKVSQPDSFHLFVYPTHLYYLQIIDVYVQVQTEQRFSASHFRSVAKLRPLHLLLVTLPWRNYKNCGQRGGGDIWSSNMRVTNLVERSNCQLGRRLSTGAAEQCHWAHVTDWEQLPAAPCHLLQSDWLCFQIFVVLFRNGIFSSTVS